MILDTSFVIDLLHTDIKAVQKLHELLKQGSVPKITAVTVFELFTGVVRSNRPAEERNKILQVLEGQLVIPLEREAAEKAGEIDGSLAKEGKKIDIADCLIAGIALSRNEKVLTRNVKDFSRIQRLAVETY